MRFTAVLCALLGTSLSGGYAKSVSGRDAHSLAASRLWGTSELWPAGEAIKYRVNTETADASHGVPLAADDSRIAYAIRHIEAKTCLRFARCATVEDCTAGSYIEFWSGPDCSSPIGKPDGKMSISLSPSCSEHSTVHEVGHAVGLDHEQRRLDRDDFVAINEASIIPEKLAQFSKLHTGRDLGPYDYRGIMHYTTWAFQQNSGDVSIVAPYRKIGEIGGLSNGDVAAIDFLYNGCSAEYAAPTCMASVDTTVTRVIPHSTPFRVTFSSNYRIGVVVTVNHGITTTPRGADVTFEDDTLNSFNKGGAHSSILYTPGSEVAGQTFVLGVTFVAADGAERSCYAHVRVAHSAAVCNQQEGNDPFVCSGRGVCTGGFLQPCTCNEGFAGRYCEGDVGCPANVADSFDTLGDWANAFESDLDTTVRVGAAGASLRLGSAAYPVSTGNRAVLPLWSLSKPSRVSYDVSSMVTERLSGAMRFAQEPYQGFATSCLELNVEFQGGKTDTGPNYWAASDPATGDKHVTSVDIVGGQFYHFDLTFDWAGLTVSVAIDGVVEVTVPMPAACATGFDTVTAVGNGWLDNFDLHCTAFVPPQHPVTAAPPQTAKPTPVPFTPTPAPTEMPAQCNTFAELTGTEGAVDYPEGDADYSTNAHVCHHIVCSGTTAVTFSLVDTRGSVDYVSVSTFDGSTETEVARYWGRDSVPSPVQYTGNVLLRFVSAGGFVFVTGKGYTLSYTCTDDVAATPAPTSSPTAVPTTAVPTAAPTAVPTTAPVPTGTPTTVPTAVPTSVPTAAPTTAPTTTPTAVPTPAPAGTPLPCNVDSDCDAASWCRPQHSSTGCSTAKECVAKVGIGASCGGFTTPCMYNRCADSLRCGCAHGTCDTGGVCIEDVVPTPAPAFPSDCKDKYALSTSGRVVHLAYANLEETCWLFTCASGQALTLTWSSFSVEAVYDHVTVQAHTGTEFTSLMQATGDVVEDDSYSSVDGVFLMRFSSDASVTAPGFEVAYACTTPPAFEFPNFCRGHGETLSPGVLRFPSDGSTYTKNTRKCWHLHCAVGAARITWTAFSTETGYDHVYAMPAHLPSVPLSTHSGSTVPAASSVQGGALLHFSSDNSVQSTGFVLQWECV